MSSLARVLVRTSTAVSRSLSPHPLFPSFRLRFHSLTNSPYQASSFQNVLHGSATFTHCGMSTSAPHEQEQENKGVGTDQADETTSEKSFVETPETEPNSYLDEYDDEPREFFIRRLVEKKELLQQNEKDFGEWKDKFLRSYAEIENVMERTRRDAENSKKFAVQSFAKNLLDVADNLSRASAVTKESFSKIDVSGDTIGAVPVLKTLLEGVHMTEKQLAEVFKKYGIEKVDPTNEQFDPMLHNAVFQVPDSSKPPGTVAVVLKPGYTLHERIIRPAEVGVTVAVENTEASS